MQNGTMRDTSSPSAAILRAYGGTLDTIGRLLEDTSPPAAILAGIRRAMNEQLPVPPGCWADWVPPSRLHPGATGAEAARWLGGIFAWSACPATRVFAELAQAPVTVAVTEEEDRVLTGAEAEDLDAAAGEPVYERAGLLSAAGLICAEVTLLLIVRHIPAAAMYEIRGGRACGEVLEPYGMRRGRRAVEVDPDADPPVAALTVLRIGDTVIGVAGERLTPGLCARAAGAAGEPHPGALI